jgi:hypothetical protein
MLTLLHIMCRNLQDMIRPKQIDSNNLRSSSRCTTRGVEYEQKLMVLKDFKYAALLSHSAVYAYVVHIHNEVDNLSASLISNRTSEQPSFHFIELQ